MKLRDKYANSIQKADFRGLQLVVGWLMRCYWVVNVSINTLAN